MSRVWLCLLLVSCATPADEEQGADIRVEDYWMGALLVRTQDAQLLLLPHKGIGVDLFDDTKQNRSLMLDLADHAGMRTREMSDLRRPVMRLMETGVVFLGADVEIATGGWAVNFGRRDWEALGVQ